MPRPKTISTPSKGGKTIRLNRYLSVAGVSSRRTADEYIQAGRVSVNGRVVHDLGTKIRPETDSVFFNGKQVVDIDPKVYILLNKPKDCITTLSDEKGRRSVLDVVRYPRRIFPVGRLDRNTTGALLLTNDGDFANLLMHPRNKVPKSYLVTTSGPVTTASIRELASGISLPEGRTAPAGVDLIPGSKNCVVGITIREGRNRQIHRMFQAAGYEVDKLDRLAYGSVSYEGLSRGEWRYLSPVEIRALEAMAGDTSTEPPRVRRASQSPGSRKPALTQRASRGEKPRTGQRKSRPDPRTGPAKEYKRSPKTRTGSAKDYQRSPKSSTGPAKEWKRSSGSRKGPGKPVKRSTNPRKNRAKDWNHPNAPRTRPSSSRKRSSGGRRV